MITGNEEFIKWFAESKSLKEILVQFEEEIEEELTSLQKMKLTQVLQDIQELSFEAIEKFLKNNDVINPFTGEKQSSILEEKTRVEQTTRDLLLDACHLLPRRSADAPVNSATAEKILLEGFHPTTSAYVKDAVLAPEVTLLVLHILSEYYKVQIELSDPSAVKEELDKKQQVKSPLQEKSMPSDNSDPSAVKKELDKKQLVKSPLQEKSMPSDNSEALSKISIGDSSHEFLKRVYQYLNAKVTMAAWKMIRELDLILKGVKGDPRDLLPEEGVGRMAPRVQTVMDEKADLRALVNKKTVKMLDPAAPKLAEKIAKTIEKSDKSFDEFLFYYKQMFKYPLQEGSVSKVRTQESDLKIKFTVHDN